MRLLPSLVPSKIRISVVAATQSWADAGAMPFAAHRALTQEDSVSPADMTEEFPDSWGRKGPQSSLLFPQRTPPGPPGAGQSHGGFGGR